MSVTRREAMASAAAVAMAAALKGGRAQAAGEPHEWTAKETVAKIAAREVSAVEVADHMLARAAAHGDLNAFITRSSDIAAAAAGAVDGGAAGALAGATVALKDNIDTEDMPTTGGTPAFRDWTPPRDAPVAAALRAAGGVFVGKANMHELAFGITSNNAAFGAVRNPYDKSLIPGGSSGGSAVAVAAGLAHVAIGTDTGGSARIPGALCGVAGFRPTLLRWPQAGIIPISSTRDTAGVFARSIADVRLADSICASQPSEIVEPTLRAARIGVPRPYFYENLEQDVAEGTEAALELMRSEGAEVVETEVSDVKDLNDAVAFPLALYEVLREMAAYLYFNGSRMSVLDVIDQMAGAGEKGVLMSQISHESAIPAAAYQAAMGIYRPRLKAAFAAALDGLDALVVPTTPLTARPIGQEETVELNGEQAPTFFTYIRNCDPTANAGLPCLSVPGGLGAQTGMPYGVEFVGASGADGRVLALGEAFERARGPIPGPAL